MNLFQRMLCIVLSCSLIFSFSTASAYGNEAGSASSETSGVSAEERNTVSQDEQAQKSGADVSTPVVAAESIEAGDLQITSEGQGSDEAETEEDSSASVAAGTERGVLKAAASGTLQELTASILNDCSVEIVHDGVFSPSDTATHVKVKLSDKVPSCYLTLFAYASNTTFDPDSAQNIRLWSKMVTDGFESDIDFSQASMPLKKGYSVIACLNVPITDDYYRPCNSSPIKIVDENGESFVDYTYPDAFITDEELEAGATSLHVSLTGDERLFEAARNGQTSLTVSIAQYPDGDDFDFESTDQIQLTSPISVIEPLDNVEVQLSEPLRAGYRVRAVVYWAQNPDIFLVKGNDYESMFHRPDDSILVNEDKTPTATIDTDLVSGSDSLTVGLGGAIPESSMVLVKAFAEGEAIATDKGSPLGMAFNVGGKENVDVALSRSLVEGDRVVAFVLHEGSPIAQTEPVAVQKRIPVEFSLVSPLTSDSREATVKVRFTDSALANEKINAVQLRSVNEDGTPDTTLDGLLGGAYMQDQGEVVVKLAEGKSLTAGQKVCVRVMNYTHDIDFFSDTFTIADMSKDEVVLQGENIPADTTSLEVAVAGYSDYEGGRLILTQGSATTEDADSRTQIASQTFTGAGNYTFTIPEGKLEVGKTVLVHLYKYDVDTDATHYAYGNQLSIVKASSEGEPSVEIVTSSITADRSDLWIQTSFGQDRVGRLSLYSYSGDTWTEDDLIYSEIIAPQDSSQRITFGADKLRAGGKVVAVLSVYGGGQALQYVSQPKAVAAAPEKQKPFARITSDKVTAGMTTLSATLSFDRSDSATYALYSFTGDTLDPQTATLLSTGSLYTSSFDRSIYMGAGKVTVGDKLQIVLTAGGVETRSNVMEVQPSPDWGTPYIAFATSAVQADAKSVELSIDYADDYIAMGDDFYCDVTLYEVPSRYTDEEIEKNELWENSSIARRIGQANSNFGQETRGKIAIDLYDWIDLEPDSRIFAKLRLPHSEWVGEEVDYVAASIPVLEVGEELPQVKVLLYNLGEDTARGAHIRSILASLGVEAETIGAADLDQTIGYLAGLSGFDATKDGSGDANSAPATEFMLMCGFGEALLDSFLDRMQEEQIRIDHKAIVTEYNRYYTLSQLIGDIQEEHEVFQALLALDKVIAAAEAFDEGTYGAAEGWEAFQAALDQAKQVLSSEEPPLSDLLSAKQALIDTGNALTDGNFWDEGTNDPEQPSKPVDPEKPGTFDTPNVPEDTNKPGTDDEPVKPNDANKPNTNENENAGSNSTQGSLARDPYGNGAGSRQTMSSVPDDAATEGATVFDEVSADASTEAEEVDPAAEDKVVSDDENPLAAREKSGIPVGNVVPWLVAAIAAFGLILFLVKRRRRDQE